MELDKISFFSKIEVDISVEKVKGRNLKSDKISISDALEHFALLKKTCTGETGSGLLP
jgi:hypothetical protein